MPVRVHDSWDWLPAHVRERTSGAVIRALMAEALVGLGAVRANGGELISALEHESLRFGCGRLVDIISADMQV